MYSTGGRGGDVYHVTNLNDSGDGSIREGIKSANGPRTIVFDISGTIRLKSALVIDKPNITIAGQTAPGDGITLTDEQLDTKADNLIIRYIRSRLGDKSHKKLDAIHVSSGSNIIFDHISASWSIDETFSFQGDDIDSLTLQWSMITESLRYSYHNKGSHGYGQIIGGLRQSVHHNLYAHHSSRSPKVSGRRHCQVDFRNNVIYNWGYNNCYDGTASYMNWANNYYKSGPGTAEKVKHRIFQLSDEDILKENKSWRDSQKYETSLYVEGNYVEGFPEITKDNWSGGIDLTKGANEERNRAYIPFNFPPIKEQSPQEAYALVTKNAGASLARDVIDKRIVNEVLTGTVNYGNKGIIDSQTDVGGLPQLNSLPAPTDKDQDGMPDDWEIKNSLNPDNPEDRNGDSDKDGYTNLEEYLNSLAPVIIF
jgi:pectate lyase